MIVEFKSSSVTEHCSDFIQGLVSLKAFSVPQALHNFQCAYDGVPYDDVYHNKYASFCGLARVLSGDRGGVELCRDAARLETFDGDVFLNLAYAEWHMNSRKRSIMILKKGLRIDRKHSGLIKFQQQLGVRSKKLIPFIPRDSYLNKTLGKLVRKKASAKAPWTFQDLL